MISPTMPRLEGWRDWFSGRLKPEELMGMEMIWDSFPVRFSWGRMLWFCCPERFWDSFEDVLRE